jgi:hypothetical protein
LFQKKEEKPMSRKDTFGNRVWRGDPKTVAEARANFEKDPKEHLIRFAVALYSFRRKRRFAQELGGLLSTLMREAQEMLGAPCHEPDTIRFADKADVLSTHLEWISRYVSLPKHEREEIYALVSKLCSEGVSAVFPHGTRGAHTRRLLTLTKVRVLIAQRERYLAWTFLRGELLDIHEVEDPRQRARVYAKAGLLCRKLGRHAVGLSLGLRACTVSRVPLNVRGKATVALAGIDL